MNNFIEIFPGGKSFFINTEKKHQFSWQEFGSGKNINFPGFKNRAINTILFKKENYAIIKSHNSSYQKHGQKICIPTVLMLVRVDDGDIESSGTLVVLNEIECGHKWKKGIEYLKAQIELNLIPQYIVVTM